MTKKLSKQPDRPGRVVVAQQIRSGPLPEAQELEHYNAIVPGAAERILVTFEQEQRHRHKLESRLSIQRALSQVAGSLMGLGIVGLAWYMVHTGRTEGLSGMLLAASGVIAAVLGARLISKKTGHNGE